MLVESSFVLLCNLLYFPRHNIHLQAKFWNEEVRGIYCSYCEQIWETANHIFLQHIFLGIPTVSCYMGTCLTIRVNGIILRYTTRFGRCAFITGVGGLSVESVHFVVRSDCLKLVSWFMMEREVVRSV
jgi:hypothetical protein